MEVLNCRSYFLYTDNAKQGSGSSRMILRAQVPRLLGIWTGKMPALLNRNHSRFSHYPGVELCTEVLGFNNDVCDSAERQTWDITHHHASYSTTGLRFSDAETGAVKMAIKKKQRCHTDSPWHRHFHSLFENYRWNCSKIISVPSTIASARRC